MIGHVSIIHCKLITGILNCSFPVSSHHHQYCSIIRSVCTLLLWAVVHYQLDLKDVCHKDDSSELAE